MMHEAINTFLIGGFRHDAHPMAMLCGMIGSAGQAFYHIRDLDLDDPEQRRLAAIRLIAKVPTIAAA
jgi:citrate synthase